MEQRKPKWWNYWGWGSGDLLGAGVTAVTSGWLLYFYTTFCGISALDAGWLLAVPRFVDAIACPLIGYISDNLRHTWIGSHIGRRKIFLMIAIPLLPSFALMWMSGQSFWYYMATYVFFELVYTCVLIPWETLAAEMTKDYKEKARFAGARILVAQASAVLASYLPTLIIKQLGKDSASTFLVNGAVFGVLSSLVVILVVIFSWERPYTEAEKLIQPKRIGLAEALMIPVRMFVDLFSTLRLRAFRQHLGLYLGGYISQDIFNTALPIFVTTVMLSATLVISQMMTLMYIVQFVSVMIAIRVVLKTGPAPAYRVASMTFSVACLLFLAFYLLRPAGFTDGLKTIEGNIFGPVFNGSVFANPTLLFWLFVPIILAGLGRGTLNFVPWSVYNYLPDVDEAVTGQRREGIFAGVMTLVRKLSQFVALLGTAFAMEAGGFVSGAKVQSPQAVHTVVLIFTVGPIVMMAFGFLVSLAFKLNSKTHAVLVHEIERLRAGATSPETAESGQVVEDLTGRSFSRLWGRD